MSGSDEKPRVIIFGGCGFVGRNLVEHLVTNDLAGAVCVVDKVPPQVAWLNKKHQECFDDPIVVFESANLIDKDSCERAFVDSGGEWDYAFNTACETKSGRTDPVYHEGIFRLSINCAKTCAKYKVKRYVEVSAGSMFSSEKTPHKEEGTVEPWTFIAKWKSKVEKELPNVHDLEYTVLRPATIYGRGDKHGLTPRLLVGAVYKHLSETMKLPWNADLKLNTIHVEDLCRAMWFVCARHEAVNQTYNVVDEGRSTQGTVTDIVADIFGINYDYYGNALSNIVKADIGNVVDEVNDKHLVPWAEACRRDGIENTPLSPYMSEELLYKKHLYLDGTKLKNLNFRLTVPAITKEKLKQVVEDYVDMKVFPGLLSP